MPDINKLPRWARDEITRLRADLEFAQKEIAALTGEVPSRVEIDPHHDGEHPRRFLRDHDTVRFHMGRHQYIDVRLDDGKVYVNFGDVLTILPRAANSALLSVETRHG